MVRITNGKNIYKVSKKAYETMYKPIGFYIVGGERKLEEAEPYLVDGEIPVSENNVDVDEIPVSEMNRDQLVKYAEKHEIDLNGVKNTREARQRVQKAMRERNM